VTYSADISADLRTDAWCPGGPEFFRTDFGVDGPAPSVPEAVEHLVRPLTDWLVALTAETSEIAQFTDTWLDAADAITELRRDLSRITGGVGVLEGRGADAMRSRIGQAESLLGEAADWTQATAVALGQARQIVETVRSGLVGAVHELVDLAVPLVDPDAWDLAPACTDHRPLMVHAQNYVELMGALIAAMFDAFETLLTTIDELDPYIGRLVDDVRATLRAPEPSG
jgi:hypothetical protein